VRALRVAFVSFHTSPSDEPGVGDAGGMNVYVDRLARSLAARGVEIDVFTRASAAPAIDEVAPGVRTIALRAGPAGTVPKEALTRFAPAFGRAIAVFGRTGRLRYDLVHSHYWQSGVAAMPLARFWRIPLVHTHHTLGEVKNGALPAGAAPEPDLRLQAERMVISSAALVTASTDEERRRVGGRTVRTLTPGVDHGIFRPGDRGSARLRLGLAADPVFLAVGRIQPLKGLDLAVRALCHVDRRSILLVAGGPSGADGEAELTRLRSLAWELGVAERVRFLGPQPHESLPDLYRAADALVVCSHSESFGLAALEAHACGTPIVGTRVGGLPTFVREGRSGFLLAGRDPRFLAARLRTVVAGGGSFRAAAAAAAAGFSWDATATALMREYRCLVVPCRQTKMRLKASPYAKPATWPTAAKRRVNHCSNCACPSGSSAPNRKAELNWLSWHISASHLVPIQPETSSTWFGSSALKSQSSCGCQDSES
jgi:D-inositol-3-phosphate glycosyltransferase